MQQAAVHVKNVHNLSEISEQAVAKIRTLISDETPQPLSVAFMELRQREKR